MARSTNGPAKSRSVTVKADDPLDIAVMERVSAAAKKNRRTESDQILMDLSEMAQYKADSQVE